MRALVNAAYDPAAVPAPSGEALAFHRGLDGYRPTPLRDLGGGVWLKDESEQPRACRRARRRAARSALPRLSPGAGGRRAARGDRGGGRGGDHGRRDV
jgi:hypothetical protein